MIVMGLLLDILIKLDNFYYFIFLKKKLITNKLLYNHRNMDEAGQKFNDFKLWIDTKFRECKDKEPVTHLFFKAIEENNIDIMEMLIYLKYPVQHGDIKFCISKNYANRLNMLLDYTKPSKKDIKDLIYQSQQIRSYECNVILIVFLDKM